ncbi:MAG: phosphoenolpyruvate--protein phosphotransferase [Burkholderiaceae bacterium]|nr:phosphoenolpyruvate--protein phosphotransferase [Burkholderiaceae bacterium]
MPTPVEVQLAAMPHTREDAVRQAGALLVKAGFVQPPYVESLLQREQVATTFLGQGLAIPHGMVEDKHLVLQTGLAVLQVPAGVAWGVDADGAPQTVQLVVAIAAASDEHIALLRRLTRLMMQPGRIAELVHGTDARAIVQALTGEPATTHATQPPALQDLALAQELVLEYPNGLHARPAARWVQALKRFDAAVHVRCGDTVADARSVAQLLSLGAAKGARLRLSAQGSDAAAALAALQGSIQSLGDEEARQAELAAARQAQTQGLGRELGDWQPAAALCFTGLAASPGLVIGTLVAAEPPPLLAADSPAGVAASAAALDQALTAAHMQLQALVAAARQRGAVEQAAIFGAHTELIADPALLRDVSRTVVQGHGAAWAWQQRLAERVAAQRALPDATLAARAADLQDAGDRVLRHLLGRGAEAGGPAELPDNAILLADDLAPSVTAQIDTRKVKGFCTAKGGPTAHTAILARSLGLPAVVAAGHGLLQALNATTPAGLHGRTAILDGYRGRLHVDPTDDALQQARALIARLAQRQQDEARNRLAPATTSDGHRVDIAANINRADQVPHALEVGAEGVGLMRTEFLFLERDHAPDEEEQFTVYRDMVLALQGKPLIVRTLDIGGDKQVPHLQLPVEDNPFLGVRGARLCLKRDDLLLPQVRALYRAARHGPLSIMFPMISTAEEVAELRRRLEAVRLELGAPVVPVGIMVEVPSAALMADRLAAQVDFFSIGTNDLTQYTLAVDRQHPELAGMADALHPAVLRLVARTVEGARRHGRWVGVCGGLAGEPLGAALLAGLGVHELSMTAGDITTIKALLRRHTLVELQALALRALDCDTADEVRALGTALQPADSQEGQA